MSSWRRWWSGGVAGGLVAAAMVALPAPASAQPAPSGGSRAVEFSLGGLQPLQPARVLDTRSTGNTVDGVEQRAGMIAAGESRLLPLAGRGGVPVVGAGAVLLNVTVTQPAAAGHVTVFPTGAARPNSSNLNFLAGQTVPNLVLVKVGAGGGVQVASAAATHVVADVVGWVPEGPDVQPLQPARVLDTRGTGRTVDGQAQATGALGPAEVRRLPLAGRAGVPASGVAAVVLNLTVTGPTQAGYLKAFPAGAAQPNASSLNFAGGQTVPNLVVAKVSSSGAIDLLNSGGHTHVIADVVGWIPHGTSYESLQPARVLDTRSTGATVDGQSQAGGAVAAGEVRTLSVLGRAGVPAAGVGAVVLNTTVTEASTASHLTVFPTGSPRPNASNLNFGPGTTRANLVVAKVGSDGSISMVNAAGATHVVADVVGWFPTGAPDTTGTVDGASGSVRMVLPTTTELAGAGDVLSLTGTAADPTQLRLAPSADVPPVGGHLVVMPNGTVPEGTLVEVTSVMPQPDGSTALGVRRAAVPDAFLDLEIAYDGPVQDEEPPVAASGDLQRQARSATRSFGFGPLSAGGFSCSGSGTASLSFDASFQDAEASVRFDLSERLVRVVLTTTPTIETSASSAGSVTCTATLSLPGKIPLGGTGFTVDAGMGATVHLSAQLQAEAGVATPVTMGFEWRDGDLTNLSGASINGSGGFQEQDTEAVLTVTPSFALAVGYLGKAELTLALALPATGTLRPLHTPCATVDVSAGISARASAVLPMLEDLSQDLGNLDLPPERVFTDMCGGGWTGTMTATSSSKRVISTGPSSSVTWTTSWTGSYSNLRRRADGGPYYNATVVLDPFSEDTVWVTGDPGCPVTTSEIDYSWSGDSETGPDLPTFGLGYGLTLEDKDDGTWFTPTPFIFNGQMHSVWCGGERWSESGATALGYRADVNVAADGPLVDTDPDPLRLVGTTTYDLGTMPGGSEGSPYTEYSYSVTYDLTRESE